MLLCKSKIIFSSEKTNLSWSNKELFLLYLELMLNFVFWSENVELLVVAFFFFSNLCETDVQKAFGLTMYAKKRNEPLIISL